MNLLENTMYKLSIITINYNNAKGLKKTIESVINQTYNDFEYIIIDGCSSDESVEILKSYTSPQSQPQPLLSWISEPDTGVYQAMNKGIKLANGEYLLFLNGGDYLVNNDVLLKVAETFPVADILCGMCEISKSGKVVHITNPPDFITFGTLYNIGLAHQATFIKKYLFDKFGFYREDFKYHADIDFWYKSLILGDSTSSKLNFIISNYNLEGKSSTQTDNEQFKKEHKIILSHPIYQKFIPDYEKCKGEKEKLKPLLWFKSKKILFLPIYLLYSITNYLKKSAK